MACCGSNISAYQIQLLINAGAQEIIIAFDKQFKTLGDEEFLRLVKNLKTIHRKYSPYAMITFMFDKFGLLSYKDSPIDQGKEIFLSLFQNRILL